MKDINVTSILEFWYPGKFFDSPLWSTVEGIITIITLLLVIKGIREASRQEENIRIGIIFSNKTTRLLNVSTKRKNFTRSEVKGILRDSNNADKYDISYLNTQKFIDDIINVQETDKKEFFIHIQKSDKFELKQDSLPISIHSRIQNKSQTKK